MHSKTGEMTVSVPFVLNQEVIEQDMKSGVLYHLRYMYPIAVEGTPTMMFIQILISEYQRHKTKLCHLSNVAPENPRKAY